MRIELGGNPELFWLLRLKQSGLFDAETPQGELLEPSPLHDPAECPQCKFGPCEWLQTQLDRVLKPRDPNQTPTT